MPESYRDKTPSAKILALFSTLCNGAKNIVFIISGMDRYSLGQWFFTCEKLGISADHGYFIRWNKSSNCENTSTCISSTEWKHLAEPIMKLYDETTFGSYIESKGSAFVWNHQDVDIDFGSLQAKELMHHRESVFIKKPAIVKRGGHIVEVRVGKGSTMEEILKALIDNGKTLDFIMCIGDAIYKLQASALEKHATANCKGVLIFLAAKSGQIENDEEAADFQNFVLFVELLVAAVDHFYAFPYKDYASANIDA